MNLIILEGPDGAGKTTLAKELEKCGYVYVHHGVPTEEEGKDLFAWRLKALLDAREFQSVVFDRLHLSERIYGPVMRGASLHTELHEKLIERYLHAQGGQVVICLPPWRVVLNNWMKNQENEYVDSPQKLKRIYDAYEKLQGPYMCFDYTIYNVQAFAKGLTEIENYKLPDTWVGSPNARFLFVGERANGLPDLPFMEAKNSSLYLHECIDAAGYQESEIAFTNAYQADGSLNNLLYNPYHPTTVIALGNVAHVALRDVQHALVAHPAYWKRFHANERQTYVDTLSKIRRSAP
jgi:predicted ATPase